jgi:hypothetical protein
MNGEAGMIGIGGLVGLATLLPWTWIDRLFPGKHVCTEVEIAAPPQAVWSVLADNANYPAWNPYHVQVTGEMAPGQKLMVHIHKPNGEETTVKPHLLRLVPNRELTWGGGVRGLFYGEHVFLLEETAEHHTRLIHKESFRGLAVRFVPLEAIDEGYALMNEALKRHIEAGGTEQEGPGGYDD